MIWIVILAALCISMIVTIVIVREIDIRDTLKRAREVDAGLERGIAVFKPGNEKEEKNFNILTRRGVMKKNPLGGYSFTESQGSFMSRVNREIDRYKGDSQ